MSLSHVVSSSGFRLGVDFGLTNTDAVLVSDGKRHKAWTLNFAGPASPDSLLRTIEAGGVALEALEVIAITGGLHRSLPNAYRGIPIHKVSEVEAVGRGGLALSGLSEALVVSAGSGTAMIAARGGSFKHLTGTAVGGGTLLGLAKLLLGTADPIEVTQLAERGDPSGIDATLADAIGGGIGNLPSTATAVNFGRAAGLETPPRREDLAAALFALVAQVIGVIALNAAQAAGFRDVVVVGHLPDLKPFREVLGKVWGFYQTESRPIIPENAGAATALGAVLEVGANGSP